MKARRVVLMAVALLLVAGCSDDVSTGPRPEAPLAQALPADPGIIGLDPDDVFQFQAGGESWSVAVNRGSDGSVTATRILRNSAPFANYEGHVAPGSSGSVDASVYSGGQLAFTSDISVSREVQVFNQMALDMPCQAELEAFALAAGTMAWAAAQYKASPTWKNRAFVASTAVALFSTTVNLYACLNAARQQEF